MPLSAILQNRVYLLTVIGFLTTISALAPFLLQEFIIEMVAHSILHITAITFGVFLIILSLIAYHSTRNTNMIFTALAFTTFTILSLILLYEDMNSERLHHVEDGNVVAVWVDVLLTVMIGFFAIGVFSNQKFPNRIKYD